MAGAFRGPDMCRTQEATLQRHSRWAAQQRRQPTQPRMLCTSAGAGVGSLCPAAAGVPGCASCSGHSPAQRAERRRPPPPWGLLQQAVALTSAPAARGARPACSRRGLLDANVPSGDLLPARRDPWGQLKLGVVLFVCFCSDPARLGAAGCIMVFLRVWDPRRGALLAVRAGADGKGANHRAPGQEGGQARLRHRRCRAVTCLVWRPRGPSVARCRLWIFSFLGFVFGPAGGKRLPTHLLQR